MGRVPILSLSPEIHCFVGYAPQLALSDIDGKNMMIEGSVYAGEPSRIRFFCRPVIHARRLHL